VNLIAGADDLLADVARVIALVRPWGAVVGYVRIAFDDDDYGRVPDHSRMAPMIKAVGRTVHSDSPATAIHASIEPEPGDIVVRKTRLGAFGTTDLEEQLTTRDVTTLLLAGVTTSGVVLSTVREAVDRDFATYVLADATADMDRELHELLISKVLPAHADVITIADLDGLTKVGLDPNARSG
jgi:nicotinamidase-related amidase